jgi:hypothetical protein
MIGEGIEGSRCHCVQVSLAAVLGVDGEPSRVGEARHPAAGRLSYDMFKGPSAKLQPFLAPETNIALSTVEYEAHTVDSNCWRARKSVSRLTRPRAEGCYLLLTLLETDEGSRHLIC